MGLGAKKDELVGKAKQKIGDATDNESLRAEGLAQEGKGNLKQGVNKAQDAVEDTLHDKR